MINPSTTDQPKTTQSQNPSQDPPNRAPRETEQPRYATLIADLETRNLHAMPPLDHTTTRSMLNPRPKPEPKKKKYHHHEREREGWNVARERAREQEREEMKD